MSQQELLNLVVTALDTAGIDYMVTGSVASSLHGEPRSTHDVDPVVSIDVSTARKLAEAFRPPRYHLDADAAADAIATRGMFNLIDTETGDKVDFWVLTDEPFDRARFARKYQEDFLPLSKVSSLSPYEGERDKRGFKLFTASPVFAKLILKALPPEY